MSKVVKLTQGELRELVVEASKKRPPSPKKKPHPQAKKDENDKIAMHLAGQDITVDDVELAQSAAYGINQGVLRVFYGTKWEKVLQQAQELCDAVAAQPGGSDHAYDNEDEFEPGDEMTRR